MLKFYPFTKSVPDCVSSWVLLFCFALWLLVSGLSAVWFAGKECWGFNEPVAHISLGPQLEQFGEVCHQGRL